MWQSGSLDLRLANTELALAAAVGLNSVRVFLACLVWRSEQGQFMRRVVVRPWRMNRRFQGRRSPQPRQRPLAVRRSCRPSTPSRCPLAPLRQQARQDTASGPVQKPTAGKQGQTRVFVVHGPTPTDAKLRPGSSRGSASLRVKRATCVTSFTLCRRRPLHARRWPLDARLRDGSETNCRGPNSDGGLFLQRLDHGENVRKRDVSLNVVRRREYVTSIGPERQQASDFETHLRGGSKRKRSLRRQPTMEAEPASVRWD